MKIGLLGGTFDPIHLGHLDVARAARAALELDHVWIVPAGVPPHRRNPMASAAHRFAMAALAVSGESGLEVADLEMASATPAYTIDTLGRLHREYPDTTFFFVTGADALQDLPTWKESHRLVEQYHFVAVSRPGLPAEALRDRLPELAARMCTTPCTIPEKPSIFLVDAPTAPVSSTDVRQRAASGRSIHGLVPGLVEAHILTHRLYQSAPENAHG